VNQTPLNKELAPTGHMRVGINFGNALLAKRAADGTAYGIALDLANELASRAGLSLEMVTYEAAGRMADGARRGEWDVAFLATDPDRATEIAFTPPYLEMDTTYLVPAASPISAVEDVDRDGMRIAVSAKSAYDLILSRDIKNARIVRAPGPDASEKLFFAENLDALAGVKPLLLEIAEHHPGTRVLRGRFGVVQQAVGTPKGRDAAAQYLAHFVEGIKKSGLVATSIAKNKIRGVSVII
jgi:polar amino acid transport system substrate-binding protein